MKRWRNVLWALLLVLPGGLWILGAIALVKLVRRTLHPELAQALPPPGPVEDHPRLDPTISTSF